MKPMMIPRDVRSPLGSIDAERLLRSGFFCAYSQPEVHTGELNLLHALMGHTEAPTWPAPRTVEADLSDLEGLYQVTASDVAHFLATNPDLIMLLNDAAPTIQELFGSNVTVRLEVFSDPDRMSDRELFARILSTPPTGSALELLDRFDNEWWFNAASRSRCLLSFGLKHI
jgi:hypothetical protein